MKAIVISRGPRSSEVCPALQNSAGVIRTAPHTTFDEDVAMRYAEFAAERNQHDDPECIFWPLWRSIP